MIIVNRRRFFKSGAVGSSALTAGSLGAEAQRSATPAEIEGPFYPLLAQKDQDFDLTQIEGRPGKAKGREILIVGKVIDTQGRPVEDATVDLWQANADGRYRHPHDQNPAALDENFQGWAIVPSGKDGGFQLKTVFPGTYPATEG